MKKQMKAKQGGSRIVTPESPKKETRAGKPVKATAENQEKDDANQA